MSVGLDTQGIKSMVETQTYPAMLWEKKPDNKVYCFLCSWASLGVVRFVKISMGNW